MLRYIWCSFVSLVKKGECKVTAHRKTPAPLSWKWWFSQDNLFFFPWEITYSNLCFQTHVHSEHEKRGQLLSRWLLTRLSKKRVMVTTTSFSVFLPKEVRKKYTRDPPIPDTKSNFLKLIVMSRVFPFLV